MTRRAQRALPSDRLSRLQELTAPAGLGLTLLATVLITAEALASPKEAEEAEAARPRLLIFPLRGPSGVDAQAKIAESLEGRLTHSSAAVSDLRSPAKAVARSHPEALLFGRVQCAKAGCRVEVSIHRPTGKLRRKSRRPAKREEVPETAAALASELLLQLNLLGDSTTSAAGARPETAVEAEPAPEAEVDPVPEAETESAAEAGPEAEPEDDGDEEPAAERRYTAIEVALTGGLVAAHDLCLDTIAPVGDDDQCAVRDPGEDDRSQRTSPYPTIGGQLVLFPGAFAQQQAWWTHLGLYFSYNRGLGLSTWRDYLGSTTNPDSPDQVFTTELATTQQDLRAGLLGRIPWAGPEGPQIRAALGFGWSQLDLDTASYPDDDLIAPEFRPRNPLLPSITFAALEIEAELRLPLGDILWLNNALSMRIGLDSGELEQVFGTDATILGVTWDLELLLELPYGLRLAILAELIYFSTRFDGIHELEGDEATRWAGTPAGDHATDLTLRYQLAFGWGF